MKHSNRSYRAAAVVGPAALVVALVGCGGGGDSSAPVAQAPAATQPATVPATAADSTLSFVTFEQGLDETNVEEPLSLQGFLPPIDDHAEPFPIG